MTPDDEAVVGAAIGYKAGRAATPLMVPVLVLTVGAGVWNFWLGPMMVRLVASTLPLWILLTVLALASAGWSLLHRLQGRVPAGIAGQMAMVPLKWSLGAALLFAALVQFGFDHPNIPDNRMPIAKLAVAPASDGR